MASACDGVAKVGAVGPTNGVHSRIVAVTWQRFGPYHLARLRGAASVLSRCGWNVLGIEVAGADHYQWVPAFEDTVPRRTLFPAENYTALPADLIRREMTRTLNEMQPDAVCVNGWAVPEAVAVLRWARRSPVRTVLMSETFESSPNPLKRTLKRWRVGQCHAAIVGGRLQAQYLDSLGFDDRVVELGYDVVDNAHFAAKSPCLPPALRHVPTSRYFFANTRLLERKGIDALLHAYSRYRAMNTAEGLHSQPWHLVISGSGQMESTWKALSAELEIAESVHWPGFLQYDELPGAYQRAGAFVHAARREPWGLVVNEAAAAGLPLLVGRRVGAASELVSEGQNGFLLDPDDRESFAMRLFQVASLPEEERRAMGRRSQELVSAFGPERFGHALRKCLGLGR